MTTYNTLHINGDRPKSQQQLQSVRTTPRSGEFVISAGTKFDSKLHLTSKDISVGHMKNPSTLIVHIKSSKTDPTRKGVDLFIGRTWNSLCPVIAMLHYLAVRGTDDGPLFRAQNMNSLFKQVLVTKVRQALQQAGIDSSRYVGHSFCIGAAMTAALRGISDTSIQILRRWASNSYTRYISMPRQSLICMYVRMSTCSKQQQHCLEHSNLNS